MPQKADEAVASSAPAVAAMAVGPAAVVVGPAVVAPLALALTLTALFLPAGL